MEDLYETMLILGGTDRGLEEFESDGGTLREYVNELYEFKKSEEKEYWRNRC